MGDDETGGAEAGAEAMGAERLTYREAAALIRFERGHGWKRGELVALAQRRLAHVRALVAAGCNIEHVVATAAVLFDPRWRLDKR